MMKTFEKMKGTTELYLVGAAILCVVPVFFSDNYTDKLINVNTALILVGQLLMFLTLALGRK